MMIGQNLFLGCINYVSCSACSAGACVENSLEALTDQINKIAPFKNEHILLNQSFQTSRIGGREGGEMHIIY